MVFGNPQVKCVFLHWYDLILFILLENLHGWANLLKCWKFSKRPGVLDIFDIVLLLKKSFNLCVPYELATCMWPVKCISSPLLRQPELGLVGQIYGAAFLYLRSYQFLNSLLSLKCPDILFKFVCKKLSIQFTRRTRSIYCFSIGKKNIFIIWVRAVSLWKDP